MDLTFSEPEIAFRDELRAWLADNHPGAEPEGDDDAHYAWRRDWQRRLADDGWAAVHWPREYGGRGATLTQSAIFFEELGRAGAPLPANVLGLLLAGPTIMTWGTEEQKERYLAPILTGEEIWCQGFSEPDAGSDLAGAEDPRGQGRRRAGSSPARRSGPAAPSTRSGACSSRAPTPTRPKHKGLTYFLMDMEQEGVQVRPLRQITGEPEFNELFIDGARDPGRERARRRRQRLEGRADDADERARRARVLPAGPAAPAARPADRRGRGATAARRPGRSPTSSASCT